MPNSMPNPGGPTLAGAEMTRRRLLGLSASLTLLAACSPPEGNKSGPTGPTTLRYGEAGAFSTFNPWAQQLNQLSTANQMFSRLVFKQADGKPIPDLAQSWKIAADGRSITLSLRPGVQWQDGKKLEASHFVEMFGYLSDPKFKADPGVQKIKELFSPVAAVEAPDPATVRMRFSAPVPYALDLLNYWYAVRFDDPSDTAFIKHRPVGTGPFKMTDFAAGQRASFEAFANYFDQSKPTIDRFTFDIFAEGSNVVSNLTSGQMGGILVNNYADVKSLRDSKDYYIEQVPLGIWPLMVNVSKPPFDKVEVRQALSYSMNREAFAQAVDFGLEKPVASPFFTDAATGYVADLVQAQSFDLDRARSLLKSAGVSNLSFTYPSPDAFPNLSAYGEIWKQDLEKIGVRMNLQTVSLGRWYELGDGSVPSVDVVPWQVGRCLQDSAVFFAAASQYRGADQRFGYRNAEWEKLVAQGRTETDEAKRKQVYQQLNRLVVDQCVNIAMVTYSETFAWSKTVTGPAYDIAGNLRLADATVKG